MDLWELVFPQKCPICKKIPGRGEGVVCRSCYKSLPWVTEPRCARCGKPIEEEEEQYCPDCGKKRKGKDVLKKGVALWEYDARMKRAMADFKYQGCTGDAAFYATQIAREYGKAIMDWRIEAIVPVPLHWKKRWYRGYNQAAVLAVELGRQLHLPAYTGLLTRTRYTKPQKGLAAKQRADNVAGAFALTEKEREKADSLRRVLLVDDIYTTGATLEECAGVLGRNGVQEVYFICLCIGRS